jgi:uncharacterized protein (TIGR02301 family)
MPSSVRSWLIVAALTLVAAPASAQSLFDMLTGGGRPAASPSSPAPPAAVAPKSTAPKPEAKKKKPATLKPADRVQKTPAVAAEPPPAAADAPSAPYEAQTLRLSEILGALAFLRDLCAAGDGDDWRNKMAALVDAEAPSGPRRDKYVSAFNRGFRGYALTYRSCTPNARAAIARYLDEANRIAGDLAYRYGGA